MKDISIIIKGTLNSDSIFNAVTSVTGVSRARILSDSRLWPVVEARMLSAIAFNSLGLSDNKIALILDRGRSTVCKSRHVGEDLMQVSKTFKEKFQNIQKLINSNQNEN